MKNICNYNHYHFLFQSISKCSFFLQIVVKELEDESGMRSVNFAWAIDPCKYSVIGIGVSVRKLTSFPISRNTNSVREAVVGQDRLRFELDRTAITLIERLTRASLPYTTNRESRIQRQKESFSSLFEYHDEFRTRHFLEWILHFIIFFPQQ